MPSLNDTVYPKFYVLYSEKYGYKQSALWQIEGHESFSRLENWRDHLNSLVPKANWEILEVRPKTRRRN